MSKRWCSVMSLWRVVLAVCSCQAVLVGADRSGDLVVGSTAYAMSFDNAGRLVKLIHRSSGDSLLLPQAEAQIPFRVFRDSEVEIGFGTQEASDAIHGETPLAFSLEEHTVKRQGLSSVHTFRFTCPTDSVAAELTIRAPDAADSSEWSLTVYNRDTREHRLGALFPYFEGLGLGRDGLKGDQAYGGGAYPYSNKGYGGINMSMQWMSRFDRRRNLGFGLIAQDERCVGKVLYNWPGQTRFYVGYPNEVVAAGAERRFPTTTVLIYSGDWRRVADEYRRWFLNAFDLTFEKTWEEPKAQGLIGEANLYTPLWFREATAYYPTGHTYADFYPWVLKSIRKRGGECLVEYEACSVVDHRTYVISPDQIRRTVRGIHALGGKVIGYVQGYCFGDRADKALTSPVSRQALEWSVMNKAGQVVSSYDYWFGMCPAAPAWQDFLAETCARLIRELDFDGVRLDSIGAEHTWLCYNPRHPHYPKANVWNEGVRTLLRKVKAAIRREKADAVLLTEDAIDFHYESIDGALKLRNYFYNEGEFLERYTLPGMKVFAACLPLDYDTFDRTGGWTLARREDALNILGVNGLPHAPWDVSFHSPLLLNWTRAKHLFGEALLQGEVSAHYPCREPGVLARLFFGEDYGLLAVTRLTAPSAAEKAVPLVVRGLEAPIDTRHAVALNVRQWTWTPVIVRQTENIYHLTLECPAGEAYLIVLPYRAGARPIVEIGSLPVLTPGASTQVWLRLLGGWARQRKAELTVSAPGLKLNGQAEPVSITIPGSLTLQAPKESSSMAYLLRADGGNVLGTQTLVHVMNVSVEAAREEVLLQDDFDAVALDAQRWSWGNGGKAGRDDESLRVEDGSVHLRAKGKQTSWLATKEPLPSEYMLELDFLQPSDETSTYMSIVREKGKGETGQTFTSWYLEFSSDRFFSYSHYQPEGGWKIRGGSPPDFAPDRWYRITVRRRETEAAIQVQDRDSGKPIWELRLQYDVAKRPKVYFEAAGNQPGGVRGMRIDHFRAHHHVPAEPVYRGGETITLRLTEYGDAPSHWGNYRLLPDFSPLDSNFLPEKLRTCCDYFTRDGRHVAVVSYTLSLDNARSRGRKLVPVTVLDADGQLPLTVGVASVELK